MNRRSLIDLQGSESETLLCPKCKPGGSVGLLMRGLGQDIGVGDMDIVKRHVANHIQIEMFMRESQRPCTPQIAAKGIPLGPLGLYHAFNIPTRDATVS